LNQNNKSSEDLSKQ